MSLTTDTPIPPPANAVIGNTRGLTYNRRVHIAQERTGYLVATATAQSGASFGPARSIIVLSWMTDIDETGNAMVHDVYFNTPFLYRGRYSEPELSVVRAYPSIYGLGCSDTHIYVLYGPAATKGDGSDTTNPLRDRLLTVTVTGSGSVPPPTAIFAAGEHLLSPGWVLARVDMVTGVAEDITPPALLPATFDDIVINSSGDIPSGWIASMTDTKLPRQTAQVGGVAAINMGAEMFWLTYEVANPSLNASPTPPQNVRLTVREADWTEVFHVDTTVPLPAPFVENGTLFANWMNSWGVVIDPPVKYGAKHKAIMRTGTNAPAYLLTVDLENETIDVSPTLPWPDRQIGQLEPYGRILVVPVREGAEVFMYGYNESKGFRKLAFLTDTSVLSEDFLNSHGYILGMPSIMFEGSVIAQPRPQEIRHNG